MGMNWNRVRYEEQAKRYGKEDVAGGDVPPQTRPFGSARWKRRTPRKSMTPEEKRRWEEAVAKVYGMGA